MRTRNLGNCFIHSHQWHPELSADCPIWLPKKPSTFFHRGPWRRRWRWTVGDRLHQKCHTQIGEDTGGVFLTGYLIVLKSGKAFLLFFCGLSGKCTYKRTSDEMDSHLARTHGERTIPGVVTLRCTNPQTETRMKLAVDWLPTSCSFMSRWIPIWDELPKRNQQLPANRKYYFEDS